MIWLVVICVGLVVVALIPNARDRELAHFYDSLHDQDQ